MHYGCGLCEITTIVSESVTQKACIRRLATEYTRIGFKFKENVEGVIYLFFLDSLLQPTVFVNVISFSCVE